MIKIYKTSQGNRVQSPATLLSTRLNVGPETAPYNRSDTRSEKLLSSHPLPLPASSFTRGLASIYIPTCKNQWETILTGNLIELSLFQLHQEKTNHWKTSL